MAFHLMTQELAVDLGTANTVIFQNGKIVARGTCDALRHTDTYKFLMK